MSTLQKITITLAAIVVLFLLLPPSPFQDFIAEFNLVGEHQFTRYMNWFFPFSFGVRLLTAWCVAIAAYYLISWILRQLDIIS